MKPKNAQYVIEPDSFDYEKSFKDINDALLVAYQVFFFEGLTNPHPYGDKYHIGLYQSGIVVAGFKATHLSNPELTVTARDPIKLLEYAKLLREGWENGKRRISHQACCILAERTECVCIESFSCPIHGTRCRGTHD
jgi:hypothetical protein